MKTLATLLLSLALVSGVTAGTVDSGKGGKFVQPPVVPTGCECFGPGFAVGLFGAGYLPDQDSDDDVLGGGVLAEYFFNPYIGIQASYGIFATSSEHHEFDGALVLRYPITSLCIAPYILAGGGYSVNSDEKGNYFVGGGLEARFASANCLGIFADGAYHFAEDDDDEDYTIVRIGVKFVF